MTGHEGAARIAVTGTPGTGKTTATERLDPEDDSLVVHLNDVIQEADLYDEVDERRDSVIADLSAVREWLDEYAEGTDVPVIVESHVAHHLPAERVVVLRCRPEEIERRLRERGEPDDTVAENAEAEALDVILSEAVAIRGADHVYEIDTTDRDPETVAEAIREVIAGNREPSAGTVDFTGYLQ